MCSKVQLLSLSENSQNNRGVVIYISAKQIVVTHNTVIGGALLLWNIYLAK